jgi:hypothetical protein
MAAFRNPLLLLLLAVGLAVAGAGCRGRESGRVIKLAHGLDVTHSVHRGMVRLGELLAAKSGGRLRVEVYANGQLGSERECLELVQLGGLGMTKVSSSVLEGFAPEFKVFGLPYLFRDAAHRQAVFDGPIGREILAAPEGKFLRGVCYYDAGSRSFYTKKPVRIPADLRAIYATAFEVDATWLVECASRRQKWIDQAQSLNIYMAGASGKKLHETYTLAWLRGLKTTYYLRTQGATHAEKSTTDRVGQLNAVSAEGATGAFSYGSSQGTTSAHGPAPVAAESSIAPKFCAIDDPECEACQ